MHKMHCKNCGKEFLKHRAGPMDATACPVGDRVFHPTLRFEPATPSPEGEKFREALRAVIGRLAGQPV